MKKRSSSGLPPWPLTMTIFLKPLRAISSTVASSKSHTTREGSANVPGWCFAS